MSHSHYPKLFIMLAASFVSMYLLMYAMVDAFPNVYGNLNQFYMAGLMTAPMAILELGLMKEMYPRRPWNAAIALVSVLALLAFWGMTRRQVAISDRQFLRSMIPHHAGAILMCEEAPVRDPDIKELCSRIIKSQQSEIAEMKAKLAELSN